MSGWIKIHRNIMDHWLYTEKRKFSKFEAWNDILLMVNYAEGKSIIKGTVYTINRGESILSLDSWGKRWNWDKSAVRRFLITLQNENMVEVKNETQTTRLIVCKYDCYQSIENINETEMKRKRNGNETEMKSIEEEKENQVIKKEKEEIKEIKFDFKKSCIDYGFHIELINDWLQVRKNKKLTNTETAFNKFINQVEINEHDKNIILEKCIEKSWGGFESDWFKTNNINFNKINTGNNGKSRTDIQQEGKDRFREKFNQQNFGDGNRD